jgi:heat shock protein HslJ
MEKATVRKNSRTTGIKAWEVIAGIIMIVLMAITLLACASPAGDAGKLEGVTWVLKSYGDAANPTQAIIGHEPTLTFDEEKMTIGGNGGVNSYGGDYTVDGSKLTIDKMMQTLMASTDETLNTQESAYLKILGSAQSFKIADGQLTITGSQGVLVFSQK